MWSEQPLETLLYARLVDLPEPARSDLPAEYSMARRFVTEEITGYIASAEPDLTDHSERHLADVMDRTRKLIGSETAYFDPYELYILCVSILFHDVGNLHGRKEHNKKIAQIYDEARKRDTRFRTERAAIQRIAGAHTGSAKDGSKDTLGELGTLPFRGNIVRAQQLAALLRLADELAEGPHRTSAYLQNHQLINPASSLFHAYANVTDHSIDRAQGRIAITYNIDLEFEASSIQVGAGVAAKDLLEFCYKRIVKLDQERRYCKHYCDLLQVFKETSASLDFYLDGQALELDLPQLALSDLVVPGEPLKQIAEIEPRYTVANLLAAINERFGGAAS